MLPAQLLRNLGKTWGRGDGGRNFGFARSSHSSPAANGQRATIQTPQGVDAQHGGELFPIDESTRSPTLLTLGRAPDRQGFATTHGRVWMRCASRDAAKPASRNSGKTRGGGDGGRNFGLPEAPTPPQQQTGNAQQFRRHKALTLTDWHQALARVSGRLVRGEQR